MGLHTSLTSRAPPIKLPSTPFNKHPLNPAQILSPLFSKSARVATQAIISITDWGLVFSPLSKSTLQLSAALKDYKLFLGVVMLPKSTYTLLTEITKRPPTALKAGADATETLCKLALRTACFSTKVLVKISMVGSAAKLCKGVITAGQIISFWSQQHSLSPSTHLRYFTLLTIQCSSIALSSLRLASICVAPWILAAHGTSLLFAEAILS